MSALIAIFLAGAMVGTPIGFVVAGLLLNATRLGDAQSRIIKARSNVAASLRHRPGDNP